MMAIDGWDTKRLDEIGTIFSGSTPSTSIRSFWDGEIVWITPYDLSQLNTPYLSDSKKRITEKGLSACSARLLPAGSVVLSSRAPIGYVAIPTVPFCTNQGCKTVKLKKAFHPVFAYYDILFNIDKIKNLGEGTTFAEISKSGLSKVEILFPNCLSEQTKIAEVLSTVDLGIEQTEELIAKYQRIKTGLIQELFGTGIDEHGNFRSERTHKFKDSPLGRIPEEWELTNLDKIAEVVDPQPDHRTPREMVDGVPYVGLSDFMKTGSIDFSGARKVAPAVLKKQQCSFSISEGAFVFGKIGTIGLPKRVPHNCQYALSANVILVNPRETASYVYWWVESPIAKRLVDLELHTTSQPAFGIQKMRSFPVPLPSKAERQQIGAILDKREMVKAILEQHLQKLHSLKTALMQGLLTGKKRVTPLLEMKDTD